MENEDRRTYQRKDFEDNVLLQFISPDRDQYERATIRDISYSGIRVSRTGGAEVFPSKGKLEINENQHVLAYLKNHPITLFGTVVRIDEDGDQLAVVIRRSTDEELWEKLSK